MKTNTSEIQDQITISRKTFLDLIAAAESARAWMAHNAGGTPWANTTREKLNFAISDAVAEKPFTPASD